MSRCSLDWSIHGHFSRNKVPYVNAIKENPSREKTFTTSNNDDELNSLVKLYFEIDALGIKNNITINPDDKYALDLLEKTSRYVNGSWEVGLIWKSGIDTFPDGRANALRRLHLLERKLDRDTNYAAMYYREMDRLLENGFAEKVCKKPLNNRVWYLPHCGVQNVNKPGKVRLV